MSNRTTLLLILSLFLAFNSCNSNNPTAPNSDPPTPNPDPTPEMYTLPIVVHIVHLGEPVGEGHNLSIKQIESQIRVLNEDFRRKEGTRGFNTHPNSEDAKIEFTLAKTDPDGNPTNGIVRIDASEEDTIKFSRFEYYASLSYWNPEQYINIWTEPYPSEVTGIVLGFATGPETDLLGGDHFLKGEPGYREGILINSAHFGESNIPSDYSIGRTLTHEMGHYLGLLHLWGAGDCATNDYCSDTPAMDKPFNSTCGEVPMLENYMTFSIDKSMNVFTNDQIARMHYVLKNSPYRTTLLTSPGLDTFN